MNLAYARFYVLKRCCYDETKTTYARLHLLFSILCKNKSVKGWEIDESSHRVRPITSRCRNNYKTKEVTEEIQQLLKIIGGNANQIVGVLDQQYYLLHLHDIYWFYTEERKVMAKRKRES